MFKERECCTDKSAGGSRKGSGGRRDAVPPADTTYVQKTLTHTHRHSSLPVSVNWKLFGLCLFVCLSICHTVSLSDCQTVPNYSAFLEPENGRLCVCASFWVASIPAAAAAVASNLWFMFAPFFPLPPPAAFYFAFFLSACAFRLSGAAQWAVIAVTWKRACVTFVSSSLRLLHSLNVTSRRSQRLKSTCATIIDLPLQFRLLLIPSALPLSTFSLYSPTVLQIVLHILCIVKRKFVFIFYQFTFHSLSYCTPHQ